MIIATVFSPGAPASIALFYISANDMGGAGFA